MEYIEEEQRPITERLFKIIDDVREKNKMSMRQFEISCGLTSILSNLRKKKIDPSTQTICRILERYPDYSAEWLLMGKGSMIKGGSEAELGRRALYIKMEIDELVKAASR